MLIGGITFMKDSGVSVGCDTDNNYCPDHSVTRAQMGSFMYRLSRNDPTTAPSVAAATALSAEDADLLDGIDSTGFLGFAEQAADSELLDGMDSAEILPIMFGQSDSDSGALSGTGSLEINTRTFVVPADGYLVISGTVQANNDGAVNSYGLVPSVDGMAAVTPVAAARYTAAADGATAGEEFNLSYTVAVPITQGVHTVAQDLAPSAGVPYMYDQQSLVIVFYPEGVYVLRICYAGGHQRGTNVADL